MLHGVEERMGAKGVARNGISRPSAGVRNMASLSRGLRQAQEVEDTRQEVKTCRPLDWPSTTRLFLDWPIKTGLFLYLKMYFRYFFHQFCFGVERFQKHASGGLACLDWLYNKQFGQTSRNVNTINHKGISVYWYEWTVCALQMAPVSVYSDLLLTRAQRALLKVVHCVGI